MQDRKSEEQPMMCVRERDKRGTMQEREERSSMHVKETEERPTMQERGQT